MVSSSTLRLKLPLNGSSLWGFQAFAVDYFYNFASAARYVGFGRGEVEVHDSHRTWLHECFGQNVLAGSSAMGGQQIFGSEHLLDRAAQAVECFASRVGVVGREHCCRLLVRHRVYTAVGEHVHVYVLVLKKECIVSGPLDCTKSLLYRQEVEFLYHSHLVHFQRYLIFRFVEFYCHVINVGLLSVIICDFYGLMQI